MLKMQPLTDAQCNNTIAPLHSMPTLYSTAP